MCLPVAAQVALTIGSGVAQMAAQAKAARAQAKAQAQASANLAQQQAHKYTEQNQAQAQKEIAMAMEAEGAQREGHEVVASAITSAEQSGVSGSSVGLQMDALQNAVLEHGVMQDVQRSLDKTALLLARQGGDIAYEEQWRRLNPPIQGPDIVGIALQTANQAVGQYQSGKLYEAQRGNFELQDQLMGLQQQSARAATALSNQGTANARAGLGLIRLQTRTERLRMEQQLRIRNTVPSSGR